MKAEKERKKAEATKAKADKKARARADKDAKKAAAAKAKADKKTAKK